MLARVGVVWCGVGVNYGGCGCVCYRCMGAGVIGTYIGVEAVVLQSWCVVWCTVCQLVSNWRGFKDGGWEGSMAERSRGFGSPRHCSGISFPSLWRECM